MMRIANWAVAALGLTACAVAEPEPATAVDGGAAHDFAPPTWDYGRIPPPPVWDDAGGPTPADDASPPEETDAAPPRPPPVFDRTRCTIERFEAVATAFQQSLEAAGAPGAGLAIACGGQLDFERAFGRTAADRPPVTTRTRFQLASTTKMFTAALGVALAEDGRLDLTAPIGMYLPTLGHGYLSVHQLLSHTAGFPTEFPQHDPDLLTIVQRNGGLSMWSTPGAVWNYSNPGFDVAGAVMQVAIGEPFGPLLERRVLRPAGLIDATMSTAVVLAGEYAPGHSRAWPTPVIEPEDAYFHTSYYGPMGGAWGTAGDLARWGLALAQRPAAVMSAEGFERLLARHTRTTWNGRDYGYGHFVDQGVTPRLVSHSGGAPGYTAYLVAVPEAGFAIAAVTHCDWWWPGEIADEATLGFVDLAYDESAVHPAAEGPERYVGEYVDPVTFGRVAISEVAGRLTARFLDRGITVPLEPLGGDSFELEYAPLGERIDFNFWHEAGADAEWIVSLWGVARRAR